MVCKESLTKLEVLKHIDTLPSDWTCPPVENEWNIARVFYDHCREYNLILNITNPDHFEYFLSTDDGKRFVEKWFKPKGSIFQIDSQEYNNMPQRSDDAAMGVARKFWAERFFRFDLLANAGFKIVTDNSNFVIKWGTSDDSLKTFGLGNPPYDNLVSILNKTQTSTSRLSHIRVLETIIEEFWGKNDFERFYNLSTDGKIKTEKISKDDKTANIFNFIEKVKKRWHEILPSAYHPDKKDMFTFLTKWLYLDSWHYDPRSYIVLPPSEEKNTTLIIEATEGCPWNRCHFCNFYKDIPYSNISMEKIINQVKKAAGILYEYDGEINRGFLSGGGSLSRPVNELKEIIDVIIDRFAKIKRFSTYATTKSIIEKKDSGLRELKDISLCLLYWGVETGSNSLRRFVNKELSKKDIELAGQYIRDSGIDTSVMIMVGLGGKQFYQNHVKETVDIINKLQPKYLAFLNTVAYPGTPYEKKVQKNIITPLTYMESLCQTQEILENIDLDKTFAIMSPVFVANNPTNVIFKGTSLNDISPKTMLNEKIEYLKSMGIS